MTKGEGLMLTRKVLSYQVNLPVAVSWREMSLTLATGEVSIA